MRGEWRGVHRPPPAGQELAGAGPAGPREEDRREASQPTADGRAAGGGAWRAAAVALARPGRKLPAQGEDRLMKNRRVGVPRI